jgi:hypothetical protein
VTKVKEEKRGAESNQAIIHRYMEAPQGNSLCSYLKQPKISFSSSSFLIQNQRTGG